MKNPKSIKSVHDVEEVDDLDYTTPSFEEAYGICAEQMEFESLPRGLQGLINTVGHGSDVAECLIGCRQSDVSNAMLAVAREMDVDRLKVEKVVRDKAASKGTSAANRKRTQSANNYWAPYEEQYAALRANKVRPGVARHEVYKTIKADRSWPPDHLKGRKDLDPTGPSTSVLKRRLK